MRGSSPLGIYTEANQEWALDFVHDTTAFGRSVRVLNVIDAYTRESLAMEVDTSFAGQRVTRVLGGIIAERGLPQSIRCDNGPELTSRHFLSWNLERKINLVHTQPSKPTQNGYVETFNGKLREECLRISHEKSFFKKNWHQVPEKAQNELVAGIRKLHELHRYYVDIYKLTSCCLDRKAREIVRIVYAGESGSSSQEGEAGNNCRFAHTPGQNTNLRCVMLRNRQITAALLLWLADRTQVYA